MAKWIMTDDDSFQHVRYLKNNTYELIEMCLVQHDPEKYEVYTDTICVSDYLDNDDMRKELEDILYGFGYSGIQHLRNEYCKDSEQIMAECIFEYYGSFQARQEIIDVKSQCIKYIQKFITGEFGE